MKKIPIYILILIVTIGLFVPLLNTRAQEETVEVLGTCVSPPSSGYQGGTWPNVTSEWCNEVKTLNPGSTTQWTPQADTSYHLLEPIPCKQGTDGCVEENGKYVLKSFDPTTDTGNNKLGVYLNIVIRLFIGLCAVAAVVMIVVGGIEYSTSELVSAKSAATERIQGALLGLLLALGAYTLLFTINPDLLNTDVDIGGVSLVSEGELNIADLKTFTLSGKQTIDGKPGAKIDFKKEACPAALAAQSATGVKAAYLLAIYAQESSSGALAYSGCSSNSVTFRPGTNDKAHLDKILAAIGKTAPVKVSCSGTAAGRYGGCMGHMQVCPSEWVRMGGVGKSPWNLNDSMTMAATLLVKEKGYNQNPKQSVCNYFGGCSYSTTNYQQSVLGKADSFQARIDKGDCNP
jgi:hypothetical protein